MAIAASMAAVTVAMPYRMHACSGAPAIMYLCMVYVTTCTLGARYHVW